MSNDDPECDLVKSASSMTLSDTSLHSVSPTMSNSNNDCRKAEKAEFPQYFTFSQTFSNPCLSAFTFSLATSDVKMTSDQFGCMLTNHGLNGHSNLAPKTIQILEEFCDNFENVDFDQLVELAVKINNIFECETMSVSTSESDDSKSNNSDSTSKSAERSQNYSTHIRKAKNIEMAMSLSLYIYICNYSNVFAPEVERHLAHVLCSTFSGIRIALFDRLWQSYTNQVRV